MRVAGDALPRALWPLRRTEVQKQPANFDLLLLIDTEAECSARRLSARTSVLGSVLHYWRGALLWAATSRITKNDQQNFRRPCKAQCKACTTAATSCSSSASPSRSSAGPMQPSAEGSGRGGPTTPSVSTSAPCGPSALGGSACGSAEGSGRGPTQLSAWPSV